MLYVKQKKMQSTLPILVRFYYITSSKGKNSLKRDIKMDSYQKMIEEIEDYAILLLDGNGRVKSWNTGGVKIIGYQAEEILNQHFGVFFTEENQRLNVPEKLIATAKASRKAEYEGWMQRKENTLFWGNTLITAIHDGHDIITGFSCITRDFTEKINVEEKLKQENEELLKKLELKNVDINKKEKRFRALLENNYDFISLKGADGKIIYHSPSSERMIGYSAEEIEGKNAVDFFHPDDMDDVSKRSETAMLNPGKPIWGVNRIKHKDGHYIWVEGTTTNLLKEEDIIALVGNFRDITDRKMAEEAIALNKEKLISTYNDIETLLNHTEENFIMVDADLNIISFNKNAKESALIYQHVAMEKGISLLKFVTPERHEELRALFAEVLTGVSKNTESVYIDGKGEKVYFLNHIKPVLNASGIAENIFITITDVTSRKKDQRLLEFNRSNLDALINSTKDLMWSVDTNFHLLTSNKHFEKMVRVLFNETIKTGNNILTAFHTQEQQERWKKYYQRAFSGETFMEIEYSSFPFELWCEISFYPIYKKDKVIGTACYARDITERKMADANLKNSEEARKLTMNAAMDAIVCFDENGIITVWNPKAEIIFGWKEEEILGQSVVETIIPEQNRWKYAKGLKNYFESGTGISVNKLEENIALNRAGKIFPIEISVLPISQNGNEFFYTFIRDITERKVAEEKLIYANRLYAFISQINQAIVHISDEATVFKEACRIAIEFGKFKMAWIGKVDKKKRVLKLIQECGTPPGDINQFLNIHYKVNGPTDKVLKSGIYYICNNFQEDLELVNWKPYLESRGFNSTIILPIKKSGSVVYTFNLYASEIDFFNNEEIRLLVGAAGDISFAIDIFEKEKLRRKAEIDLEKNEFRLNEAQQIAHLGNWEIDFITGKNSWSDEACRILGAVPDEQLLSIEYYVSLIHPDDAQMVKNIIKESEINYTNTSINHRIIRKDGTLRYIHAESKFEFNEDNQPERLHGILHDITSQRNAEMALEQSEANLRIILDLIPHAIFVKSLSGEYIFANKSCAALFGLTPNQLMKKKFREILPAGNHEGYFIEQDKEVIFTDHTKVIPELELIDFEGNKRYFNAIKVPYTPAGKTEKGILGVTLDITERKMAEAERMKMVAEIVQRNKDLEQFSYIISHNLRSPVANIIGIIELVQSGLEPDEAMELFGELSNSAKKLDNVIKDINVVLQVKHDISESKEVVRFGELLSDVVPSIENIVKNSGVEILSNFSALGEMLIFKSYVYSIFYNLISNSIKYKQPDKKPIIEIYSFIEGNKMGLVFKDNGLGIDLEKSSAQVFGLYKRFHSHVEGKGMGLFMVKMQVESLGGNIYISSEVNKGTEFRIIFDTEKYIAVQ